jgi:hypothetical protein
MPPPSGPSAFAVSALGAYVGFALLAALVERRRAARA